MARIIYKYPIDTMLSRIELELPNRSYGHGPVFLRVGLGVNDKPYVWVEQDSNEDGGISLSKFVLRIIATGDSFDSGRLTYIGSFVEKPHYVWHIYLEN